MTRSAALACLACAACACTSPARSIADEPVPVATPLAESLCLSGVAHRARLQEPGKFEAELARFADLGVRSIRYDVDWVDVESREKPGTYDLDWLDGMVARLEARGIRSIPLLAYGNPLYNGRTDGDRFYPTAPEPFAAYAAAVARRFGKRLGPYEIWNEPNAGYRFFKPKEDPARYAAILEAAAVAIHDACPDCETLFGGVFWHPEVIMGGNDFIAATGRAAPTLWTHLDGLAVHPYAFYPPTGAPDSRDPPDVPMLDMLTQSLAATGVTPAPPLWITEVGWPVQPSLDERTQASHLVKAYVIANRANARATCWYDLEDGPNHGKFPPEDDFGLLHYAPGGPAEATPKRAYSAFQNLGRLVGGLSFARDRGAELGLAGDGAAALFLRDRAGTKAVTVLWNAFAAPGATVRVPLHRDVHPHLFDAIGTPLELVVDGDVAVAPVDDEPRFLVES